MSTTSDGAIDAVTVGSVDRAEWIDRGVTSALVAFVVLELMALPLILVLARDRWFYSDDFDYLVTRRAGDIGDLLRPHNGHWSTLPILAYRLLWSLFGLHSYLPYQVMAVAAHLVAIALVRVVMRRAGVGPWIATVAAGSLILFGGGVENFVAAAPVNLVASFAFGLTQLILADHDGAWRRRDWLGLLAGLAALLCSGVGLAMAVIVGMATWTRRGWRVAAAQAGPLLAIYALWWVAEDRSSVATNPDHRSLFYVGKQIVRWDLRGATWTMDVLGHSGLVGLGLGIVLIVGLYVRWRSTPRSELRRRMSVVAALAVGAGVFLTTAGWARWASGADYVRQSRYMYLTAGMVMPAFAVAVPGNVDIVAHNHFVGSYHAADRDAIEAVAQSPLLDRVPAATLVDPKVAPYLTAGWLRQARADGKMNRLRSETPADRAEAALLLGFSQLHPRGRRPTNCQPPTRQAIIAPPVGTLLTIGVGDFAVSNRTPAGGWTRPVPFEPNRSAVYLIQLPDLDLRVQSTGHAPVELCVSR